MRIKVACTLASAIISAIAGTSTASSGALEDATVAYDRGDYATAMKGFREAAERGDAIAEYQLGLMYRDGHGAPRNGIEAVKWLRKAADSGSIAAITNLGRIYELGQGVPQNYAEAVKWFRKAAERKSDWAMMTLGRMYESGRGVPQNFPEAIRWFRTAADQGNAGAQNKLGIMYQQGRGVPQSYADARNWYRKAAEQGYAYAQHNLGVLYFGGLGTPQDYTEAANWYRKAAKRGYAEAQNNLGVLYNNGRGVPQDYVQAHMWFNLAATNFDGAHKKEGRDQALNNRDLVAAKMTREQIAEAQRLAQEAQRLAQVCMQDFFGCVVSRSQKVCEQDYEGCIASRPQFARQEDKPSPQDQVAFTGTGFFTSDSGHIITNAHVVKDCLVLRSSRGGQISEVAIDEQSDLALFIASEKPKAFARLRGEHGAHIGEQVVVVGFPLSGLLSSDPIVTTGIISALSGLGNDRRTIQTTAPVQPGNTLL
jgi:TPR repeat protein